MKTSFGMAVDLYNEIVRFYYKNIKFKKLNAEKIKLLMNQVMAFRNEVAVVERIMERGHLYTRVIPKSYIDKVKYKSFNGYVISYGIDLDMFVAMINQIIISIYKYLFNKLIGINKWTKVIYALSISTRNKNSTRRHVEAHMICLVPRGLEKELEDDAKELISEFIQCAGYDFMLEVFNLYNGVDIVKQTPNYNNTLAFKLFDFNYPARRNEMPLTKFINYGGDVEAPRLKAEAILHVDEWWKHVNEIIDKMCNYVKIYY